VADVVDGKILSWLEVEVSWSRLHDEGTPGSHHARVAKFLRDHHAEAVVANHVGNGMVRMLDTMDLPLHLGAAGDARAAVRAVVREL
jgi:predicted Fe-Mo cluster-binding NifX family protein